GGAGARDGGCGGGPAEGGRTRAGGAGESAEAGPTRTAATGEPAEAGLTDAGVAGGPAGAGEAPPGGQGTGATGDRVRPEGAAAGLLAPVFFCWHAWAVLRGYFWQDDFRYIYGAATPPLGRFLFPAYGGHPLPVG